MALLPYLNRNLVHICKRWKLAHSKFTSWLFTSMQCVVLCSFIRFYVGLKHFKAVLQKMGQWGKILMMRIYMGWSSVKGELALPAMGWGGCLVNRSGVDTSLHSLLSEKFVISVQQIGISIQVHLNTQLKLSVNLKKEAFIFSFFKLVPKCFINPPASTKSHLKLFIFKQPPRALMGA